MFNYISSLIFEPEVRKMTQQEKNEIKDMVDNVLHRALLKASDIDKKVTEESDDLIEMNPQSNDYESDSYESADSSSIEEQSGEEERDGETYLEEIREIEKIEEKPLLEDNLEKPMLSLGDLEKFISTENNELLENELMKLEDAPVTELIMGNNIATQTENDEDSDFEFDNEDSEENFDNEIIDDYGLIKNIANDVKTLIGRNPITVFTCSVIFFNSLVFAFLMF